MYKVEEKNVGYLILPIMTKFPPTPRRVLALLGNELSLDAPGDPS